MLFVDTLFLLLNIILSFDKQCESVVPSFIEKIVLNSEIWRTSSNEIQVKNYSFFF